MADRIDVAAGTEGCYLLHFSDKYKHARHYIGFSTDIPARVALHNAGRSHARLTQAAARAGITMVLARVWVGASRDNERKLKNLRAAAKMCPFCNPGNKRGVLRGNDTVE